MDEPKQSVSHPATKAPGALLAECDIRFQRRSGPGGQNRNKVETAVILHHRPSGLTAEANERRSQQVNRQAALFRLRVLLALEVRQPVEREGPPSPLWLSRIKGGRIAVNPAHDDFPALLAEALDVLEAYDFDTKTVAEHLGCSASQLTRFLKEEPRAFALFNERRRERGLRPLR